MSEPSFAERLTNVIAWLGWFSGTGFIIFALIDDGSLPPAGELWAIPAFLLVITAIAVTITSTLNYLICGRTKHFPWKG
jgi:hypothetical protein